MRPTRFFTGALRWLVPSTVDAASLSASIWAGRMRAGPDPKRPSAGRSSSGIVIFVAVTLDILRRVGRGRTSARHMGPGSAVRLGSGSRSSLLAEYSDACDDSCPGRDVECEHD